MVLEGMKTNIVGILMICIGLFGVVSKSVETAQATAIITTGMGFLGIRSAIAKK